MLPIGYGDGDGDGDGYGDGYGYGYGYGDGCGYGYGYGNGYGNGDGYSTACFMLYCGFLSEKTCAGYPACYHQSCQHELTNHHHHGNHHDHHNNRTSDRQHLPSKRPNQGARRPLGRGRKRVAGPGLQGARSQCTGSWRPEVQPSRLDRSRPQLGPESIQRLRPATRRACQGLYQWRQLLFDRLRQELWRTRLRRLLIRLPHSGPREGPRSGHRIARESKTTTMTTIRIPMSEQRPVTIDPEAWPVIASATDHDGQVKCQANNEWRIKVRQHSDGRRIVYGSHDAGNGGQHIGFRPTYGGFLVDARAKEREVDDETIRAIRRVAGLIDRTDLGEDCIQDMPAAELT
jgi:hypothetical protein